MSESDVAPFTGAWIETRLQAVALSRVVKSRPSRARGLKREYYPQTHLHYPVAPFTGAWIETLVLSVLSNTLKVAPFTGAWIETFSASKSPNSLPVSRPSRARGLKHKKAGSYLPRLFVAPFTGAWIETSSLKSAKYLNPSRPSRARGLKL